MRQGSGSQPSGSVLAACTYFYICTHAGLDVFKDTALILSLGSDPSMRSIRSLWTTMAAGDQPLSSVILSVWLNERH